MQIVTESYTIAVITMESPQMSQDALEKILTTMEEENIEFVRFELGDMNGISRCKVVSSGHAHETFIKGQAMALCSFSADTAFNVIQGTGYFSEIGYASAVFLPDLSTFRTVPWLQNTALVLTEPSFRGKPVTSYPRYIARQQINRLSEMGYSLFSAHEHEFYVIDAESKKPLHEGNFLSTLTTFAGGDLLYTLARALTAIGIRVETLLAEFSPGQIEITYKPEFGIRAADNAHMYRTAIKEIAQQRGYIASFMTKPWLDKTGNSAHFNHSLWDAEGKKNVMYDPTNELGISQVAQYWMAGILAHAPAISLLMAPTTNCQKRFKPFTFAPSNVTWGIDNRTTALRMKVEGEAGTYLENRMAASGSNPYLTLAATVAAGMDGIIKKLPLPTRVTGDAYAKADIPSDTLDLPGSLQGALEAFQKDSVITEAFGAEFCKAFVAIKLYEIEKEKQARENGDAEWEYNNYFKRM